MLTDRSGNRRLLACIAACGMCLFSASKTLAADCGCDVACNSCDSCPTSACDCLVCSGAKHNCVYKALDAFAGGVEKLLGLDKCGCDEKLCDDACDAAAIDFTIRDPAPVHRHHHPHSAPAHAGPIHTAPAHAAPAHAAPAHTAPVVEPYSGPTRDIQLTPTGPSQWEDAGRPIRQTPRLAPSQGSGQHLGADPITRPDVVVPPPVRLQEQNSRFPEVDPTMDRESLFDTMSDPFQDDQTRTRTDRSVRPTSYEQDVLRPVRRRPLP